MAYSRVRIKRMELLKEYARGYLYYVSLKGVTGSNTLDLESVQSQYQRRKTQSALPVMVGLGIQTPEMAADVAAFADGVIVGAALINQIQQAYLAKKDCLLASATLISDMRRAMDNKG